MKRILQLGLGYFLLLLATVIQILFVVTLFGVPSMMWENANKKC